MPKEKRSFSLEPIRRFLNIWLGCAFIFALAGFVLGLMKAAPHEYMRRELPGVFLSTLQAQLGPALGNGLVFGFWLAVLIIASRLLGGRFRIRLIILGLILVIVAFALQIYVMQYGANVSVLGIRLHMRWGAADQFLRSAVGLGMEEETLRRRIVAVTLIGFIALILLAVLHMAMRPWLRSDPVRGREAMILPAPVAFVGLIALFMLMGRHTTDVLPRGAPEIILISIDTLRADHLPLYGYARETSPNLAALAREGATVDQFISQSPWTLPAHATMFTGLPPYRHGANDVTTLIDPEDGVFPELLKQKGYRTGGFVTGLLVSQAYGFDRGFDIYSFHDFQEATPTVVEAASWFLGRKEPGFLFLHLFDAHYPYRPPAPFNGHFSLPSPFLMLSASNSFDAFVKWAEPNPAAAAQTAIDRYDEEILFVDFVLGKFFEKLKKEKRWDNTLVVVLSDHGEEFYDHGAWGHSQFLYDEAVRVPLIVKLPGGGCAGSRLMGVSVPQSALPSLILSVAGKVAEANPALACGADGVPALLRDLATSEPVLAETTSRGSHRFAARTPFAKLLEPYKPDDPAIAKLARDWEYFDLSNDPTEKTNLYAPGKDAKLEELIAAAKKNMAFSYRDISDMEIDAQTTRRLRSLGYLH